MRIVQKGFTLIELMITILIAAILLAITIPGFQSITLKSRQTSAINNFAAMIGRARSEAVTRNRQVVVCASAAPSSANPTCSGANTWETGWIMFAENTTPDGQYQGGEILLQTGEALPTGVTVRGSGGFAGLIVFSPGTGLLTPLQGGGLKYCDSRGFADIRVLNVGVSGQVRVATDSNANGAVEDAQGNEVEACTP